MDMFSSYRWSFPSITLVLYLYPCSWLQWLWCLIGFLWYYGMSLSSHYSATSSLLTSKWNILFDEDFAISVMLPQEEVSLRNLGLQVNVRNIKALRTSGMCSCWRTSWPLWLLKTHIVEGEWLLAKQVRADNVSPLLTNISPLVIQAIL